jgi:hypothetical protein
VSCCGKGKDEPCGVIDVAVGAHATEALCAGDLRDRMEAPDSGVRRKAAGHGSGMGGDSPQLGIVAGREIPVPGDPRAACATRRYYGDQRNCRFRCRNLATKGPPTCSVS